MHPDDREQQRVRLLLGAVTEAGALTITPHIDATEGSKPSVASPLIIVGRIALLLIAAAALASALALARARDRGERAAQASTDRYVCPMHPEVVSRTPGECPICRMALERADDPGTIPAADGARNRLVDVVKRRVVTQLVRAPAALGKDGVVAAVLHDDDLVGLSPGSRALFLGTTTSRTGIDVRLASEPPVSWDASTSRARFVPFDAAQPRETVHGREPESGWLELAPRPRDLLLVPVNAVLYTATGPYVLAATPDGRFFAKRSVTIGRILDSGSVAEQAADRFGAIVVLSGLREGERIVVEDTFFLDAERRLRAARGQGTGEVKP